MTEILDESVETLNDVSTETDTKAENVEAECSKPKRRRRGKKRRNKSQDNEDSKSNETDEARKSEGNSKNSGETRKRPKLLIRPTDVPKAPENSTQFIIDDHDECHLYFSFETPDPYKEKDANDACNDAALQDIDYEYQSMQDQDNTAYYIQDFELSYSNMRYEETMRLTKPDLVTALENLDVRVRDLEHKMYEKDPGTALEQLQRKLLRLQEENVTLREEQQHLRKTVVGEDESGSDDLLHDSESDHSQDFDDRLNGMIHVSSSSSLPAEFPTDEGDVFSDCDSNSDQSYDDAIEHDDSSNSESSMLHGFLPDMNDTVEDDDLSKNCNNELNFKDRFDECNNSRSKDNTERSQESVRRSVVQDDSSKEKLLEKYISKRLLENCNIKQVQELSTNSNCIPLENNSGSEQLRNFPNNEHLLQEKCDTDEQEIFNSEHSRDFNCEQLQESNNDTSIHCDEKLSSNDINVSGL